MSSADGSDGIRVTLAEAERLLRMLRVGGPSIRKVANDLRCHPMHPNEAQGLRVLSEETHQMAELLTARYEAALEPEGEADE